MIKILSIVFYAIALVLIFFYWLSGISVAGLAAYSIGFLGLVLSLITIFKKKKRD